MLGHHLVDRNTIGHILTGNGIAIRSGEPKGAAPMGFVAELVRAALNDGEIRFVACQRREPFWELVG